jgi:membrane protease YdiL (CAAX protease family)
LAIVLGVLFGLLFISALLADDSIINVLAIVLGVLFGLLFISALLTDDSINMLAIVHSICNNN